ncbi:hypothetical protein DOZ80_31410 [Pseudomonas fluorescens]|uniref:TIR domain-containing protein n=1 Tax=Pseudomonas fluorescens TaxID=294 RepID=A0A327MGC8_PSEFL|nr:toll/interleukin-1 receptor domain-containing protein [Pseudomonas fluorescens]RAI62150.1 hypothetical protein DOZ80_31410 [Pseudomonas fluorescens]
MARNITAAELKRFSVNVSRSTQETLIKSMTRSEPTSTFLSHSSKDKELVFGAMKVIQNHGGLPYIDEIDPEMPPYTTEATADLLKQRIRETKRFVLLTTPNSKDSRWVPWELGIADGVKGLSKIALFAASDTTDNDQWTSSEYLGLYRRIVWGKLQGHSDPLWMVLNTKKSEAEPLTRWLASG